MEPTPSSLPTGEETFDVDELKNIEALVALLATGVVALPDAVAELRRRGLHPPGG
ncbi:MAG: hypothetical protein U0807_16985 [Candidatus Binatia bacterium]